MTFKQDVLKRVIVVNDLKKLQEVIDSTDYWDCKVLNLNVMYFGDCLTLYIEDNETYCWKMQFLSCYSMRYITDAIWRNTPQNVKDMKKGQLGYYCQDISVLESEYDDFYKFKLDLSIMSIEVVCKEIKVKKELTDNIIWFWK